MSNTKSIEIKAYIVHEGDQMNKAIYPSGPYGIQSYKPSPQISPQTTLICEQIFTVEIPVDYDPRPALVKNLEAKKTQARAEFAATVVAIDRQINELLAIECTAEAA